jgi:hypothetical protein
MVPNQFTSQLSRNGARPGAPTASRGPPPGIQQPVVNLGPGLSHLNPTQLQQNQQEQMQQPIQQQHQQQQLQLLDSSQQPQPNALGVKSNTGEPPRFDLQSDFPALGGMPPPSSAIVPGVHSDFAIQHEDFPALGSMGTSLPFDYNVQNGAPGLRPAASQQQAASNRPPSGSVSQPAASSSNQFVGRPGARPGVSSHPAQAPVDAGKYGLMGLLSVIRMIDSDVNTLALGVDLTNLGLNLNSTDLLYSTFAYPSSLDNPMRKDPDYVLPYCYYMQPPALKMSHLAKFSLETLFYIFYAMPKDTLQVFAAKELYNRGWRYHKDMQLWFTSCSEENLRSLAVDSKLASAAPGPGPAVSLSTLPLSRPIPVAPSDSHIYFDVETWQRKLYTAAGPTLQFLQQEVITTL